MKFNSDPQPRSEEASRIRERLDELKKDLKKNHQNKTKFIPTKSLKDCVTPAMIAEWIAYSAKDAIDPKRLGEMVHQQALRTFCVLILIEKENYMAIFLRHPYKLDKRLPFDNVGDLENFLEVKAGGDTQEQNIVSEFGLSQKFVDLQWRFWPYKFLQGEHKRLTSGEALPFFDQQPIGKKSHIQKVKFCRDCFILKDSQERNSKDYVC